ncbi:hypothetical protein HPB47_020358 [Ixodes persulcatus]|uniref:Uncharacterized protein n=1 Tax=Ixodes persulcatus TaxID=34615 RepID=A0AC60QHM6_IXOPE|nr:hypothetical protein HPB47_020358 [Ixodes persulcatus]
MTVTKLWNPVRELSRGYGRLPFPIESTDDLPNAHSVVLNCKRNLDYLFFVHTSPDHHLHRNILRDALGKDSLSLAYNWTKVFFVGLPANKDTSRAIETEAAVHGDIVVLPYYDTYKNLTYKFVYGMKWVTEYCSGVKYVVKIDDDVVVNLALMMKYLNEVPASQARVLHCQVWEHMPVLRETNSPWYLSKDVHPNKEFSEYCSGRGLVFRSSLLRPLYNATFCLLFHGIDDAFVTGDAALVARVGHVDIECVASPNATQPDVKLRPASYESVTMMDVPVCVRARATASSSIHFDVARGMEALLRYPRPSVTTVTKSHLPL